jgi:hypothetical protein
MYWVTKPVTDETRISNEHEWRSCVDRIRSKDLVQALCSIPDSPRLTANPGNKPISEMWLANSLRRFGIKPHTLRMGERVAKGYALADFTETFARYLR